MTEPSKYTVCKLDHKINLYFITQALPSKKEAERSKHFYACCIGQMYTIGYPISINALQDQRAGRFLRYPLYPWQETDLWAEDEYNVPKKTMHLIGVPNFVNSQRLIWDNEIDLHRFAFLSDHVMKSSGHHFNLLLSFFILSYQNIPPYSSSQLQRSTYDYNA